MNIKHKVYYVTGSKGGVGKSFIANALISYLFERQKEVRIIDTDDSNPDIWGVYKKHSVACIPLTDSENSWAKFFNQLDEFSSLCGENELHVVVNGAARDNQSIRHNAEMLNEIFDEKNGGLGYSFSSLWVMSNVLESAELLEKYLSFVNVGKIFTFRNLHFGEESDFTFFNDLYPSLSENNTINGCYNFPRMSDMLSKIIHREKLPFSSVEKFLSSIGNQAGTIILFKTWMNKVRCLFNRMEEDMGKVLVQKSSIAKQQEQEVEEHE